MKILVTCHLGYIGSVMVPQLHAAGHDVVGCDSNLYERCTYETGGATVRVPIVLKDVRKGAEQVYAAYHKSNLTLEEFEGPRYQRISHIRKLMKEGILSTDLRDTDRVAA